MLNEDNVADDATTEDTTLDNNVTPENPETPEIPETPETPETEEETPENPETPEDSDPQDLDSDDLELIDSLLTEEESDKKEETPTEPTFFPKEENKEETEEEFIDEELLEDIEKWFTELETELTDTKESLSTKERDLEESNNTVSAYSDALDKLGDHPILGPLNEKILKGEKVDIPEYLEKSLQEDLDSLPNMEDIASERPWVKEAESLQDKLTKRAKQSY